MRDAVSPSASGARVRYPYIIWRFGDYQEEIRKERWTVEAHTAPTGEKAHRLSVVPRTREPRATALRNGDRGRGSLNYDEWLRLIALRQRLEQGVDLGSRTRASGALGESGLIERLSNDGF